MTQSDIGGTGSPVPGNRGARDTARPVRDVPEDGTPPRPRETDPESVRTLARRFTAKADRAVVSGITKVTDRALGPYQTAVVRIGFSLTWLVFLLFEWPNRHELYGPDGPWSWELGRRLVESNHAFTVLLWSDSTVWFEAVYALAVLSSAALLVGWRTRTMSVLFMVGVLSLQNRSVFMGDGGDNVIHLMAMYLVLTRCGLVWSLDARRRARRRPDGAGTDPVGVALWTVLGTALLVATVRGEIGWFGDDGPVPLVGWATVLWSLWLVYGLWWWVRPTRSADGDGDGGADAAGDADGDGGAETGRRADVRRLMDVLGNVAHNAALLVIMVEVCLIYATAGWYKIQGSRWQDGTAVYYPLHLDYFSPWPGLAEVLGSSGLMVMLLSYGTVIVQVAFPFTLFNRRVKNVLLALMMLEHAGIAVVLGLPFFSLAMIAADAVFLPTVFLVWLGGRASRLGRRLRPRSWEEAERDGRTEADGSPRTLVG
ncbi:HTTM domain-containing protein [Streptomyces glaucosporus]|uniref:HTTM domain-containing protein n=1 Tax=Streptomyces glaucosporus TaxID=284044 RepID=A0ABP5UN55_9ACTN